MPAVKNYPSGMRHGDAGGRIYSYWKRIRNTPGNTVAPEFSTYFGFYKWTMESGYTVGARLYRRDVREPYGPDNCVWVAKRVEDEEPKRSKRMTIPDAELKKKWDETVNRIRLHYGMEPI